MAVVVTHPFVSPVADEGDPNEVGPNEWNAEHTIVGLGTAAEADSADFATAAQGAKADTAVQPADLTAGNIGFTPTADVPGSTVETALIGLFVAPTAKLAGAVGDGVANDRAALVDADAMGTFIFNPGTYNLGTSLTLASSALLIGADFTGSNLFGHYVGLQGRQWHQRADRTAAMYTDTPTVYTYITDLAGYHANFNNTAGYQEFVSTDSGGRTMVPVFYVEATHSGYGDLNVYQASIGVTAHATWGSATSWTGRNSATIVGGHVGALSDGANLYAMETVVDDNGHDDVAGLGIVLNFSRQGVQNVAYRTPWIGIRAQSGNSTERLDAVFQGIGDWRVGLDLAGADFDTTEAAIALKQDQRIYFAAAAVSAPTSWYAGDTGASLGTTYVDYNGTHLRSVVGGNATLLLSSSQATIAGILAVSGNTLLGNTALRLNDTDASHYLIVAPGSNLSANRTLTVTTGDADRTLDFTKIVNNDVTNTFTATQNISGSAAFFTGLNIISTDDSASGGPYFVLRRDSASPAVNDNGPGFIFQMRDSGNNLFNVGGLASILLDPTDGSEDSEIQATAYAAGSAVVALAWSNGVKIGSPTSGYMGFGTLNLDNDLYKDGLKVVGARDTGWTAMTGTPDESTAYATGSVTLPQLAGRVMALQTALTTHGLIGA